MTLLLFHVLVLLLFRPDITVMVDWALKIVYLSILLLFLVRRPDNIITIAVDRALRTNYVSVYLPPPPPHHHYTVSDPSSSIHKNPSFQ